MSNIYRLLSSYEKDDNNPWKVIDVGDWESRIDFESIYIYTVYDNLLEDITSFLSVLVIIGSYQA